MDRSLHRALLVMLVLEATLPCVAQLRIIAQTPASVRHHGGGKTVVKPGKTAAKPGKTTAKPDLTDTLDIGGNETFITHEIQVVIDSTHNWANEVLKLALLNPVTGVLAFILVCLWVIFGFGYKQARCMATSHWASKIGGGILVLQIFYSAWLTPWLVADKPFVAISYCLFFALGEIVLITIVLFLGLIGRSLIGCFYKAKKAANTFSPLRGPALPFQEQIDAILDRQFDEKSPDRIVTNMFMSIDEPFLKSVAIFIVQLSLMFYYINKMATGSLHMPKKVGCDLHGGWHTPNASHPLHMLVCNDVMTAEGHGELSFLMWVLILIICFVKADAQGDSFHLLFWRHALNNKVRIISSRETQPSQLKQPQSSGLRGFLDPMCLWRCVQMLITKFCSSEIPQWRCRCFFSFTVNYAFRRYILYTAPVVFIQEFSEITTYNDLLEIQCQVMAVFVITKLDDLSESRTFGELMDSYRRASQERGTLQVLVAKYAKHLGLRVPCLTGEDEDDGSKAEGDQDDAETGATIEELRTQAKDLLERINGLERTLGRASSRPEE